MKRTCLLLVILCAGIGTRCADGPCSMVSDSAACLASVQSAPAAASVRAGMTMAEVTAIMKHPAERRELAGNVETWAYLTDYRAEMMTAIVFTDGKVTAIKQEPWK